MFSLCNPSVPQTGQKLGLRADKAREAAAAIIRSERLTRLAAARDEL